MSDVEMQQPQQTASGSSKIKPTPIPPEKLKDYELAKEYYEDIALAYMTKKAKKRALEAELTELNDEIGELEKNFLFLRQLKNDIKRQGGNYVFEGERKRLVKEHSELQKGKEVGERERKRMKTIEREIKEMEEEGKKVKPVVEKLRKEKWM
jgi:molybdopterin converting factor small subunit